MGRLVFYLFLVVYGYSSQILNISYFGSNGKLDILFSLDEPFKGKVSSIKENDYQISGISFNRIEQKKFKHLVLIVSPIDKNRIELKIFYKKRVKIKASVTAKGYGLRIRLLDIEEFAPKQINSFQKSESTKEGFSYLNYFLVLLILIILIIVLIFVKKQAVENLPVEFKKKDGYKLIYQKMIDHKNKLVMIEFLDVRYLLLMGENNTILLEKYFKGTNGEFDTFFMQDRFETLFQERLKESNLESNKKENNFIENATKLKDENEI